ncbi:MAG: cytochrome c [Phenylobacterium sp.]|uniref:c-type cytochrome n=1 Tax=Phenylobacterium sp. TaxID=1871053 RepID=UPI001B733ABC|nr:cytochrome c [Phenylobacterium sp.]MBP7815966.1 cytochrome c [Phenylobacterium sp.]MBP9232154.1 cytochrome c [Phenylobacterium sp.]MBP9756740.1 cytochrome c [Phenylobacterium sp.]
MRFTIPMLAVALGLCAAPAVAADGKELYLDNCAACHQPTGKGIPGAFPALAGSKVAQGDPKEPITRLLKGRGGMPAFSSELNDLEIAKVLTYVRVTWGNKGKPVQPAQVTALRVAKTTAPKSSVLAH